MNPGPVEEAGKAVTSTIDALRSTPVMLGILVFNLIFVIMVGYLSVQNHTRWNEEATRWSQLVQSCLPSQR